MTGSIDDVAAVTRALAEASKTAAEAEKLCVENDKARAEAEKQRVDNDKTRADADKVRADTEKMRADAAQDRRLAQNKVDVAVADLNTKRIANAKALADAQAARGDKLVEQATGAVPSFSTMSRGMVTFSQGRALREGEAVDLALTAVASSIADKVADVAKDKKVFVTAETQLVTALATYWQVRTMADTVLHRLQDEVEKADQALAAGRPRGLVEGAGLVIAAVAGKVVT